MPDGGNTFEKMDVPTPNAPNQGPRELVSGIFINELMARNSSTYLNNLGEFDDWLELYNSNDVPVNVGGLYLTDQESNLTLWQIPSTRPDSTTIPSKGFLVFYPTTKIRAGVLHSDFQLAGNGEFVALVQMYQNQAQVLDSISYPPIGSDVSYGRIQDASSQWITFTTPTPNASNHGASGILDFELLDNQIKVYPNPTQDRLIIDASNLNDPVELIEISDLYGRVFLRKEVRDLKEIDGNQSSWLLTLEGRWEPGIYFIWIKTRQNLHTQRVMITK